MGKWGTVTDSLCGAKTDSKENQNQAVNENDFSQPQQFSLEKAFGKPLIFANKR
jgi:hypothetical protein